MTMEGQQKITWIFKIKMAGNALGCLPCGDQWVASLRDRGPDTRRATVVYSDALWFIKCSAILNDFAQGGMDLLRTEAWFLSIAAEIK